MTEKLYNIDSFRTEFSAAVTDCRKTKNGYALILDRTAFFPEGGGQAADTGCAGELRITDVQEISGEILHYCDRPAEVGTVLDFRVDREQRLRRMQNHSGEHIVSGLAHRLYGCENVGFHMAECMTIDFDIELTEEQIVELERLANETVRADLPIRCYFPDAGELKTLEYRSKLDLTENIRIVEIEGIDRCACCAPHVNSTGQVGCIKLLEHQRHRGGVRIELICGMDALDDYGRKQENVTAVSRLLSVKRQEIAAAAERILSEQQRLKEQNAALSMELVKRIAESYPYADGNICVFDSLLNEPAIRELVNLLMDKCGGIAAAFYGTEGSYRYVIGSRHVDLRKNARRINERIGGRGGGTAQMIQGSASLDRDSITEAIRNAELT